MGEEIFNTTPADYKNVNISQLNFSYSCSVSSLPKTLTLKGEETSTTIKDITLTLTTSKAGDDKAKVTVFKVDVNLGNMDEETEEETGLYIPFNDDDDNSDTIPDYQHHPVEGEDDLRKVTFSCIPSDLPKTFTLSWGNNIKLWETTNKETEITQTIYTSDQLPKTYYVEGINPSSSVKDTEIKLTYTAPNNTNAEDTAKITVFTLEEVNLYYHSIDEFPFTDSEVIIKPVATMKSGNTYLASKPALSNDGNWYYNFPSDGVIWWKSFWGTPSFNWKHIIVKQCDIKENPDGTGKKKGVARWYGYSESISSITDWGGNHYLIRRGS